MLTFRVAGFPEDSEGIRKKEEEKKIKDRINYLKWINKNGRIMHHIHHGKQMENIQLGRKITEEILLHGFIIPLQHVQGSRDLQNVIDVSFLFFSSKAAR